MGKPISKEVADAYLRLIAKGMGLTEAARSVGVTSEAMRRRRIGDPTFAADFEECRAHAREQVEKVLYERALEGESWAVKTYLAAEDPDKYGTSRSVSVQVRGELEGRPVLERVAALQKELADRQALALGPAPEAAEPLPVLDAELVE